MKMSLNPFHHRNSIERVMMQLSPMCRREVEVAIDSGEDLSEECRAELVSRRHNMAEDDDGSSSSRFSRSDKATLGGKAGTSSFGDDVYMFIGIGTFLLLIVGLVFLSRKGQKRSAKVRTPPRIVKTKSS